MSKTTLEYHLFEIWQNSDGIVDIEVRCEDKVLDVRAAARAADSLGRHILEEDRGQTESFSLRVYQDGGTHATWNADVMGTGFDSFLWAKRAVSRGLYGGMMPGPKPARWFVNFVSTVEFGLYKAWSLLHRLGLGGGEDGYDVQTSRAAAGQAAPQSTLEELAPGVEGAVEARTGNVVWLRGAESRREETGD